MSSFSQRMGFAPAQAAFQKDFISGVLRNRLWNILSLILWQPWGSPGLSSESRGIFLFRLWDQFFNARVDAIPASFVGSLGSLSRIRDWFFSAAWNEVYDFMEFTVGNVEKSKSEKIVSLTNRVLEAENSAYRFVGGKVTAITDDTQIKSIDNAINLPFLPVSQHVQRALELFSDRETPDYRNSVKESISAIESACKIIAEDEKATLGEALKKLKTPLHPALEQGWLKLYGWTSDAGGIRHALIEGKRVPTAAEARFMLITASAFASYLIEQSGE